MTDLSHRSPPATLAKSRRDIDGEPMRIKKTALRRIVYVLTAVGAVLMCLAPFIGPGLGGMISYAGFGICVVSVALALMARAFEPESGE